MNFLLKVDNPISMNTNAPTCLLFTILVVLSLSSGCKKADDTSSDIIYINDSAVVIDPAFYTLSGSGGKDVGRIFLAFETNHAKTGTLVILDEKGNVMKEKKINARADNFQKWNINGQTVYSYFEAAGNNPISGVIEGYDIICDTNFNVLSTAKFLPPGSTDATFDDRLDIHDFICLGENHYMAIATNVESPTNIPDSLHPSSHVKVLACLIQEVNNGQVVFQWDGTSYPEFYGASVENNDFSNALDTMDYMHMNSICIDPNDNNIICSFRNLNEIIKINRTSGNVMWRLGGIKSDFVQTTDEGFLRQHYVRFDDDKKTLIFLDNGDSALRPYSRILEFQLNETAKKINNFKAYNIPDQFIRYAGSVKKTNDNYFIGGGSANYTLQVNYLTDEVYLRLDQKTNSYRSLKY
jgi:arylsulfate sulfotransferase